MSGEIHKSTRYKVSAQGIKRDLQTANGDYESIDLGMMDEDELYLGLKKFNLFRS